MKASLLLFTKLEDVFFLHSIKSNCMYVLSFHCTFQLRCIQEHNSALRLVLAVQVCYQHRSQNSWQVLHFDGKNAFQICFLNTK